MDNKNPSITQVQTPSLESTIEILSNIWKTNADISGNDHILERIHSHIKHQLPVIIKNYNSTHIERETRKKSLELLSEEFIETFLNRTKYYYSNHSELYFSYNQVHYSIINEDEIHHRILTEITGQGAKSLGDVASNLLTWKYKIKNRIIKNIQNRDILKSIPESNTIQHVIGKLHPNLFRTRDHAKYFLTLLGDVLLKKSAPLIYFISSSAKELIKDLGAECCSLFGINAFNSAFKFKYYEHNYNDCRIVNFQMANMNAHNTASAGVVSTTDVIRSSDLQISIIDLFCVAAHYSHRYGNADEFLVRQCKTSHVRDHAWFFKTRTETRIIDEFMKFATEPSSTVDCGITWHNMLYLWKMYLSEFQIPNMIFNAVLKTRITEYLYGNGCISGGSGELQSLDVFPNITSRHLPMVSKFISFWSENCTVNDDEIELEIDELSTLFNEYLSTSTTQSSINTTENTKTTSSLSSYHNISDAALLGMIRHFYPDVNIEDDKYLVNVGCKMWSKKAEIRLYLDLFKMQCMTNNISIPQPLYNAYEYYCSKCYESTDRRAVSKRYFEKFLIDEYSDYLDENGLITTSLSLDSTESVDEYKEEIY
jgi:hypothetical protein